MLRLGLMECLVHSDSPPASLALRKLSADIRRAFHHCAKVLFSFSSLSDILFNQ